MNSPIPFRFHRDSPINRGMGRLCTLGGALVASYLGWFLGSPWGFGWAFTLGAVASLVGVWLGWKLARRFA